MKPNNRKNQLLALLAAASCAGSAFAGDLPVSRTEAAVRLTAPTGQFTMLALPLNSIVASGTITSTGSPLGVSATLTANALTNHAITITSRVNQSETGAYGKSKKITGNAANTVTAAGLTPSVGDKFVITELFTLSSVFDGNSPGIYGFAVDVLEADSDKIYVEDAGAFNGYWYMDGVGWKSASDGDGSGPTLNPEINPGRGIMVSRNPGGAPNATWYVTGTVVSGRTAPDCVDGFNLMNNPFSVSTTLAQSGIQNFITSDVLEADSDKIYIEAGGLFQGYYFNTDSNFWSSVNDGGTPVDAGATVIGAGKALLYYRLPTTPGSFALPEPFTN